METKGFVFLFGFIHSHKTMNGRVGNLKQQALNQEAELRGVLCSFVGTVRRLWNLPSGPSDYTNAESDQSKLAGEDRLNRITDLKQRKRRLEVSTKDALQQFGNSIMKEDEVKVDTQVRPRILKLTNAEKKACLESWEGITSMPPDRHIIHLLELFPGSESEKPAKSIRTVRDRFQKRFRSDEIRVDGEIIFWTPHRNTEESLNSLDANKDREDRTPLGPAKNPVQQHPQQEGNQTRKLRRTRKQTDRYSPSVEGKENGNKTPANTRQTRSSVRRKVLGAVV